MSRDARWVLALLAAALVATAVVGVRIFRQVKELVATAQRASDSGDEPFLYAPVDRAPSAPPARFAARLPRLDEFARRGEAQFPPPAHVKDLLCAGDPDMWGRLRASLEVAGAATSARVWETWGSELRFCGGDGCFALDQLTHDDPAPVALPAWIVAASCPGLLADAAFARPDAPALAVLQRAERARWHEGATPLAPPRPARIVAAAREVLREGPRSEHRGAAFALAEAGPEGVEALLALHARERDPDRRRALAMALGRSSDRRAWAVTRASCAQDPDDPMCSRQAPAGDAGAGPERPEAPAPAASADAALLARLRALALLPEGAPEQGASAAELLVAAGRGHWFDTETGQFPNEHDALLRALARLGDTPLRAAVFEELPQGEPDDDTAPYLLRAYLDGERFETKAKNHGDWYDVEATVGLLNSLARARGLTVRWLVLPTDDQTAIVVAGPEEGLRAAVAEELLAVGGAGEAMKQGKDAEAELIQRVLKSGPLEEQGEPGEPVIGAEVEEAK